MTSYITGLAGGQSGYFTDNNGNPKLWVATETWGLPVNAGNYSVTYQNAYDNFFSARAAQGFTVTMTDPAWAEPQATAYNGNDWDGTTPLAGGSTDPSAAALNSAFWTRVDYGVSSAQSNGITIGMVLYNADAVANSSALMHSWTTTQWTAWTQKIATRYASQPNIIWMIGNDAFSPFSDSVWDAMLTGLANAGDSRPIGVWYNPECTSRYITDISQNEPWGTSHSAFNFCYTYNAGYWIIDYAYLEKASEGASTLLPVIWGDGFFWNGDSGAGYDSTQDRALRQEWWWCLTSGARGVLGEAENVYPWVSSSAASVTGDWFFANNAGNIASAFTSWAGWQNLIPDTSSALVTAGRGTQVSGLASGGSGGQYEPAFTNNYVTASRTPDGTLAVCYLPNHTTITVNQSLLAAGYTAHWVDPVTGAATLATAGSTYNSTAKGTNSQGDPDWVLLFQGTLPQAAAPPLYSMRRC
jgi:Protein of unknown function (DUF4038)/Putative collagen-binding domain of a collagenase